MGNPVKALAFPIPTHDDTAAVVLRPTDDDSVYTWVNTNRMIIRTGYLFHLSLVAHRTAPQRT